MPLMVAVIGGEIARFRPLIDLYRQAGAQAGHAPETLNVGIHAMGFVADTTREAQDRFFPGWQRMFTGIGRERGWPPATRAQFDQLTSPNGAFLVEDSQTVAGKILLADRAIGGIDRFTIQMSPAAHDQPAMLRSIALLGREVRSRVNAPA